jgi:hypothetical protein
MFENCNIWNERKEKFLKQKMHIVHIREQTTDEMQDCKICTRQWTRYDLFVDEKTFKGNLELALERNFLADSNNVSESEREIIREKLRNEFYSFYKVEKKGQQALIFD